MTLKTKVTAAECSAIPSQEYITIKSYLMFNLTTFEQTNTGFV